MASPSRITLEALPRVSRRGYATAIPLAPPKPPKPPAPPADPNRIYTPRKSALHAEYSSTIQDSPFFLILGHENFSVAKFTTLRKELAKIKPSKDVPLNQPPARLSVIRHAIFGAAIKSAQPRALPLVSNVQGPAAILAFPSLDPPHLKSVLRVIDRSIPKSSQAQGQDGPKPKLQVLGAYAEGRVFQLEGVKHLSTLPTLDTLRAQLVGLLSAPAAQLAGVLDQARGGRLSRTLEGLRMSLEEKEKDA
jgi:ribosomal protein L10